MLSERHIERYARHILLPEVGGRGQARLLAAKVALVGAGVAADACAAYLAASGIGGLDWRAAAAPLFVPAEGLHALQAEPTPPDGAPDLVVEVGEAAPSPGLRVRVSLAGPRLCVARAGCARCLEAAMPVGVDGPAELQAVAGTLAATEALLALLGQEGLRDAVLGIDASDWSVSRRPLPPCRCAEESPS
ncbi:MAG: hypothetical protein ACK4N5_02375 [Myxococcales bacterium]